MGVVPLGRLLNPAMAHLEELWVSMALGDRVLQPTDNRGMPYSVTLQLCPFLATTPWSVGSALCQQSPGDPRVLVQEPVSTICLA